MSRLVLFAYLIILAMVFDTCQRKHLRQIGTEPQISKRKQRKKVRAQTADFKYVSFKSKLEYTDGLDQFTAHANIRLAKDSVIWVSISPALGVEVLRCLISKDSVFIINKFQKEYYLFSYAELRQKLNFDINYDLVQTILFGNPPYDDMEGDSSYADIDTSFTILQQSRKNVLIDNYVNNKTLKLEKLGMKDKITDNTLDINYEDFRPLELILFAYINKISLKYRNNKGFQNIYIGIEHNKIEITNKDLKFPFNIKNKFERRD